VKEAISRFLVEGGDLESVALELCAWQRQHIPHYAAFCGTTAPARLEEIPAVPVALFRDLHLCASPAPSIVFRTSGTTSARRGEHRMPDSDVYEAAASRWFHRCVPEAPVGNCVSLTPNPAAVPDSSLGHMIHALCSTARWYLDPSGQVDVAGALADLAGCETPVFLATTSLALDQLLEDAPSLSLPPGSAVMATGGSKGRTRQLNDADLKQRTLRCLGPVRWIREYGMTELSSQLWDTGDGYRPPPWLHVYTVDPVGGHPAPEGLICFVDLANWGSCLAVETQDLGRVEGGIVHLAGRLPGAPLRGCSLSAEPA
jgi:hypothetical protein